MTLILRDCLVGSVVGRDNAGVEVGRASWHDDTSEGWKFRTMKLHIGGWTRFPDCIGLAAVYAWLRSQGATSFTVSAHGQWEPESEVAQ